MLLAELLRKRRKSNLYEALKQGLIGFSRVINTSYNEKQKELRFDIFKEVLL
jgi:hypothetical protein